MLKNLLLAAGLIAFSCLPACAEGEGEGSPWADAARYGTAGAGQQRYTSAQTGSVQSNGGIFDLHAPGDRSTNTNGSGPWADAGTSQQTARQLSNNLQTSMGGPIIIMGKNTFIAPSNLAYQVEHNTPIGGRLPKVNLDSFVHKAKQRGVAEMIYGDEGTNGPPPLRTFKTIETGGVKATTGHPSDAPSAWY